MISWFEEQKFLGSFWEDFLGGSPILAHLFQASFQKIFVEQDGFCPSRRRLDAGSIGEAMELNTLPDPERCSMEHVLRKIPVHKKGPYLSV